MLHSTTRQLTRRKSWKRKGLLTCARLFDLSRVLMMYQQFSYWDNVDGEVLEVALDNAKRGARFIVRLSIIILLL